MKPREEKEKNTMKRALIWVCNIIILVLAVLVGLYLISVFEVKNNTGQVPSVFGFSNMNVLTGSMRPVLEPGDMIIVKAVVPEEVRVGDIATYRIDRSKFVTHRVIEVFSSNGEKYFRTKGDANNVADDNLVSRDQLVGKMALRIPYGGYVANFLKTPYGFTLLIIIPSAILIGSEIKSISSRPAIQNEKTEPEGNLDTKT